MVGNGYVHVFTLNFYSVFLEHNHIHQVESHWKFQGGKGDLKNQNFKGKLYHKMLKISPGVYIYIYIFEEHFY